MNTYLLISILFFAVLGYFEGRDETPNFWLLFWASLLWPAAILFTVGFYFMVFFAK